MTKVTKIIFGAFLLASENIENDESNENLGVAMNGIGSLHQH